MNVSVLRGHLSRPPEIRELPSGDQLVTLQVTVPSEGDRPAESVPVVCTGPSPAAAKLQPETEVVVIGRVRRRFFRVAGATRSATEVVAEHVVPARNVKRARRVVLEALAAAEEAFDAVPVA